MELSHLRVEDGFRLRGEDVSRLETFVDAGFAFSMTMLVIFYNQLPDTAAELRDALRKVPSFVLCFILLAEFWNAHNVWSRRYGLEDRASTVTSLAFLMVVLIWIYPLRMVISSGLSLIGAVVAEFVAGTGGTNTGLAYQILQAGYQLDIPLMFAALLLISLAGIALFGVMSWVSRRALSAWHESEAVQSH